jgi:putative aldouronate transport system permease protein
VCSSDLGLPERRFLMENSSFRAVLIATDLWKEMGWNTIIFLAAIAAIDPTLYEAAYVDGAGRWSRAWRVTVPCIQNTIGILFIVQLGNLMQVGFEQIYNLYNPLVFESGDVVDTYLVRNLSLGGNLGALAAGSFVKSVICLTLLATANSLAKRMGQEGIY